MEYETQQGASAIVELLKEMAARKASLISLQADSNASSAFSMADLYFLNAVGASVGNGYYGYGPYDNYVLR